MRVMAAAVIELKVSNGDCGEGDGVDGSDGEGGGSDRRGGCDSGGGEGGGGGGGSDGRAGGAMELELGVGYGNERSGSGGVGGEAVEVREVAVIDTTCCIYIL